MKEFIVAVTSIRVDMKWRIKYIDLTLTNLLSLPLCNLMAELLVLTTLHLWALAMFGSQINGIGHTDAACKISAQLNLIWLNYSFP